MEALSEEFADSSVCILGLGYVGLTLAVAMADAGFRVDGVEIRPDIVEHLNQGHAHFFEPGLNARLQRLLAGGRLRVSTAIPDDTQATVFIVTVGTPLDNNGRARTDMIIQSAAEIAARLDPGDMVIMRSTVRLGTTRKVVIPVLDRAGVPYDIAFCPERTVEGQALTELRQLPQIIGAATQAGSMRAARLFNVLTPTTIRVSSIEVAEVTKLIDNTYRDITFAFANEVARMCDAAGISALDVVTAGKLGYPRTSVPLPGPVGGPCLNKDTHILAESFGAYGFAPGIALAARTMNEDQPGDVVQRLRSFLSCMGDWPDRPVIALLGMAFKGRPATDDLRGTMAKPLVDSLRNAFPGAEVRGWDAVATATDVARFFGIQSPSRLEETVKGANLVIIANNHPRFQELLLEELAEALARPAVIYDFWNHFTARDLSLPEGVRYIGLGDGQLPIQKS